MAGITDSVFRLLCRSYGAEGTTTEMISAKALCFKDKHTQRLAEIPPEDTPCALQLFGHDPDTMARAAVLSLDFHPAAIDLNMGCPAPKIVKNGDGSALMKDPNLAFRIVQAVCRALSESPEGSAIPVTVKMRSGWDANQRNAAQIAALCEQAGAHAICIHGRTRSQLYAPPVDASVIADVKRAVSIPVIGNGDIFSGEDAIRLIDRTGCDGVMVGRGALGNPFLFAEIAAVFDGKEPPKFTSEERYAAAKDHLMGLVARKGEAVGVREARKHMAWYCKGMPGACAARDSINRSLSADELLLHLQSAFGLK